MTEKLSTISQKIYRQEPSYDNFSDIDERFMGSEIASIRKKYLSNLIESSVIVPVHIINDELFLLFTVRSSNLRSHAGEICFPGGRKDEKDRSPIDTAFRETYEEVGIPKEKIKTLGYLKSVPTLTGFIITPIVGLLDEGTIIKFNKSEVETYFSAPLSFFLDEENRTVNSYKIKQINIPIFEYTYQNYRIWGATAAIISSLCSKIRDE